MDNREHIEMTSTLGSFYWHSTPMLRSLATKTTNSEEGSDTTQREDMLMNDLYLYHSILFTWLYQSADVFNKIFVHQNFGASILDSDHAWAISSARC